ncbi:AAA family ATPase [Pseudokordiimonas caeni]|uniref:AAA family ATPase n=1 Tax=Pseudokordiimonas caeni TaxID=2997908 RepID=UPI002810F1FB|nr:AAA family ATPase [Pseudokordiimonas caeni]
MSADTPIFEALQLEGWRQFDSVNIRLHPRLTVLTGANGAGKSSLLRIFSSHFGYQFSFLATPQINNAGGFSYVAGLFKSLWGKVWQSNPHQSRIGVLHYSNGVGAEIVLPNDPGGVAYNVSIHGQQPVMGIHIDAHQPISPYQAVGQIPSNIISASQAYDNYNGEIRSRYQGGHTGKTPMYRMKEAITSMAMFGEGNRHIRGNQEILDAYNGFIEALKIILPEGLGFEGISVRPPEVVLLTKTGEFILDAASGGLLTLIDLTWRLHMFSRSHERFVVTIDEPENHLHPTMQRSLMRKLVTAFPAAQFIIATHSPFMVSSVRDSNVYVLRYKNAETEHHLSEPVAEFGPSRRIVSEYLDTINKAGSASEILRDVLGVPATIPEWVEDGIASLVQRYREVPVTSDALRSLRHDLTELGYGELYPDALAELTRDK